DPAAYTALVEGCLPLVTRALRRLSIQVQSRVDPRELIGSGVQGLHQAIRRYAPDRGVPFERFAETRIRGAIHLPRSRRGLAALLLIFGAFGAVSVISTANKRTAK
ncbi:MAG: hypothetical protein HGA76_11955, partial [Candidatus Firestonebacteria bacterium]|nr:hypothetical protein [Candidatus Firestonebacteria bacterium]